eukprot:TRINITY_DN56915_c0_g1_i1.p1 TRINITY_DN56915_c0_g1~~TRINITY_DN56915_c0_g1_i1.p1  ORF type:complete len:330 (+),score=26.86 TRINITY_DN56915_c0_g1_i1:109-1098(+)
MGSLVRAIEPDSLEFSRYFPHCYHGVTKTGIPICVHQPQFDDICSLLRDVPQKQIVQIFASAAEDHERVRLPACTLAEGRIVGKTLLIIDLQKFSRRAASNAALQELLCSIWALYTEDYPGCFSQIICINAPMAFAAVWRLFKPCLMESTKALISIYSSSKKTYLKALLELASVDQLPYVCGGSCACGTIDCQALVCDARVPWTNPAIVSIVNSTPLNGIMNPIGARLYLDQTASLTLSADGAVLAESELENKVSSMGSKYKPVALGAAIGAFTSSVTGSSVGACVGLLAAPFTFGASIPLCWIAGATAGAFNGTVLGSALGYAYAQRR